MKYLIENHDDLINVNPYYLSIRGLQLKLAALRLESGFYEDKEGRENLIDIIAGSYNANKNWLMEKITSEEKTIAEAKEEDKKNQEYIKETQLELELGIPNV